MPAADRLTQSLQAQPLLIVLRPGEPLQALPTLQRLQTLGVIHVEIAWQPVQGWSDQMAELIDRFPALKLGARGRRRRRCRRLPLRGVADAGRRPAAAGL